MFDFDYLLIFDLFYFAFILKHRTQKLTSFLVHSCIVDLVYPCYLNLTVYDWLSKNVIVRGNWNHEHGFVHGYQIETVFLHSAIYIYDPLSLNKFIDLKLGLCL